MGQIGGWVAGDVPPDEGYWEALLRDGENGRAAPAASCVALWDGWDFEVSGAPAPVGPAVAGDPWEDARRVLERGEVLELPVMGCNRGGVLVQWNGIRGFVPASHLMNLPSFVSEDERYRALQRLIGTQLRLRIIELEPEQGRFVLSERANRFDEANRWDLLNSLCPGDICQGRVTNLCSFGAFVDLGGVEGLVHISELSWGRVDYPSDVVEQGQSVEVYVLNIDRERGRVGLSIKRLQPDPWQFVDERYQIGQVIEVVITHVVDFGAFAQVEQGVEGLIHVSELAEGNFLHPRNVIQEGDVVPVRILNVDSERRRMGLSLRLAGRPGPANSQAASSGGSDL